MRLLALLCASALAGCISLPAATPPPVIAAPGAPQCPPKVNYTQAQDDAFGKAVAALSPDNPIIGYLKDYKDMRDADDVCLGAQIGGIGAPIPAVNGAALIRGQIY